MWILDKYAGVPDAYYMSGFRYQKVDFACLYTLAKLITRFDFFCNVPGFHFLVPTFGLIGIVLLSDL
jgi:hypothetical protein